MRSRSHKEKSSTYGETPSTRDRGTGVRRGIRPRTILFAAVAAALGLNPSAAFPFGSNSDRSWPQWGGPTRDFSVPVDGLARSWPSDGPPVLWKRVLGDGHSSIVFDEGRLFTLYRPSDENLPEGEWSREEAVVALDASTGRTLWRFPYPSEPLNFRFGAGPHSTPLVVGDRLFTAGTNKQIHAFEKSTGEVLWSHDLVADFDAPPTLIRPAVTAGYACSPLAYRDLVIVTAGGPGQSVIAFRQRDGSIAWKSGDFLISPSSPILIDVEGQEQLVVFGGQSVNGLDPRTGEILWSHPHDTNGDMNTSTPIWGDDGLLFISSAYNQGSRALRLERSGGETTVTELWFSNRLKIIFGNAIRIGDVVYGSSGDFGPAFLTALDVRTGELLWQERGFGRSTFLHLEPVDEPAGAGRGGAGRLIVLDEDGTLLLADVSRDGLEVISRQQVLQGVSWTVPTLLGTTLFLRDRSHVLALDLGTR